MATKTIAWGTGTGNITVTYGGSGNGTAVITSDNNNLYEARSQQITFKTTAGSPQQTVTVTIAQAAKVRTDISTAVVTAANQTYSGSALTPVPTVTLNGTTIPSTGYDVAYSNNTNAGTATITVTGKGDYTGTATGTFTIAKANPTYTAPTANSLTYNRSSQYLTTTGSTSDGTIYYSSNGTNWYTTRRTGTNAGSYTTYWKLTGDANHNDVASTSISVTIAKATPVVNVAPSKATSLTYTGSAQNLLTGGSMKHSSTDSTAVAGTFTYAQGTNAGTYSSLTWSFAPTDSTNYNSASGTVSGSVSIAKASRTLSFAVSYAVVVPSGTITKTATPSAGSGDGAITYSISSTTYATINSSSGKVTAKTGEGSATVTATIAEGTNYLSASASYTLYVFATTHDFAYTGSVQPLSLPPGSYQLQCWGAQGGSSAADSSHGITAKAGGKGGYSVGVLTINNPTTVYAFVGGQGDSGNGGWNGGGGGVGTSTNYQIDSQQNYTGGQYLNSGGGTVSSSTMGITDFISYSGGSITWKWGDSGQTLPSSMLLFYNSSKQYISGAYWGANNNNGYRTISASEIAQYAANAKYIRASFFLSCSSASIKEGDNYTWQRTEYGHTYGTSKVGCGGGSTDIALTTSTMSYLSYRTNRSSASLLSRIIVAGGGSGGAMSVKAVTSFSGTSYNYESGAIKYDGTFVSDSSYIRTTDFIPCANGSTVKWYYSSGASSSTLGLAVYDSNYNWIDYYTMSNSAGQRNFTMAVTGAAYVKVSFFANYVDSAQFVVNDVVMWKACSVSLTSSSQVGYVGGGADGGGYSNTYKGRQSAAGTNGGFGYGANQTSSTYSYCSGDGGGGWYGGGSNKSNSTIGYVGYSGGGSGFVNTLSSASYRPSGYTGLQLDSGSTTAGSSSFVAPGGGNETGHAGNGYARITRL